MAEANKRVVEQLWRELYDHDFDAVAARFHDDGEYTDVVVTEHVEHWHWHTGEHVALPITSIHEFRDGRIARWWTTGTCRRSRVALRNGGSST
jgi:ketosteroid isomerase-like protein